MRTLIVACRTLEKELLAAMSGTGCTFPIRWLPAGAHNVPEKRKEEIRRILEESTEYDTVLLAMSLCGGALTGLESPGPRLIVPRCDDCITLLLGSAPRRMAYPATYFLTEGWLAGGDNIRQEYQRALEKYGSQRTDRIFSAMLAHYKKLAFVDTGCGDVSREIRDLAQTLNLEYVHIPGTLTWLEDLLTGNRDDRFLIIPPRTHRLTVLPQNITVPAPHGANLLELLRHEGILLYTPCGGNGTCGKCRVQVNGQDVSACATVVTGDLTVVLPHTEEALILRDGLAPATAVHPIAPGYLLAFDIGTTSVVAYLLDGSTGAELGSLGAANPQHLFGADVISRIQAALQGNLQELTRLIQNTMTDLATALCHRSKISPEEIGVVSLVGNPAMRQLFLGISPKNLATIPFAPEITTASTIPCGAYFPLCSQAILVIPPDLSGYVGTDTLGGVLATGLHEQEDITLLVDIGTNGEMVLGNKNRMIACATAAGPALEGANIHFGMRGAPGAIDHVRVEHGTIRCSVIGSGTAIGICGSGLIDGIAAGLELGLLNPRGRIRNEERRISLTDDIYLTQEDIRQFQMAKGAIHAGIQLMTRQLGISVSEIRQVLLAGAFGSHLDSDRACRTGLLPPELAGRITSVGNAAGTGAKMLALDSASLATTQQLVRQIEFLELASLPEFPKTFAKSMIFP